MTTKISRVRELMAAGEETAALALVARFPRLGAERETITRGHAARSNPAFYAELGYDVDALVADAVAAIRAKYRIG